MKKSPIKKSRQPLKHCLAAELTNRNSDTASKIQMKIELFIAECFRRTTTDAGVLFEKAFLTTYFHAIPKKKLTS